MQRVQLSARRNKVSKYFSQKLKSLTPYTPGEQPKDLQYVKLNTNESPFPPSEKVIECVNKSTSKLMLYCDPECRDLVNIACDKFGVSCDEIIFTNGSDEVLNFAFMAFCDDNTPAVFPDITYGFYPVFAQLNNIKYKQIPLSTDFTINIEDYFNAKGTIFIANPNAPTGIALSIEEVESIVKNNPDNVVVIDEAYVDFGAQSALHLIHKYDNLLVTQTFSKSRSLAGARLGFGIGCKSLIKDLNTIKYSTNPYNVNSMTMQAGIGSLIDEQYTKQNCNKIIKTREWTVDKLKKLGFEMTDSKANFIFAKHKDADGEQIYLKLKEKGVLVRHFNAERLNEYNRITVGSEKQMIVFIDTLEKVLEELL